MSILLLVYLWVLSGYLVVCCPVVLCFHYVMLYLHFDSGLIISLSSTLCGSGYTFLGKVCRVSSYVALLSTLLFSTAFTSLLKIISSVAHLSWGLRILGHSAILLSSFQFNQSFFFVLRCHTCTILKSFVYKIQPDPSLIYV